MTDNDGRKSVKGRGSYSCAHEHGPCEPVDGNGHGHVHDHGHPHAHTHGGGHKVKERKLLLVAIAITLSTMFVELVGGLWSNSLALMSDAGHMLTHFLALAMSYAAIWIASRESSPEYSFGLYRSETLAALFNAFFLVVISGFIIWEAYERFTEPGEILVLEMLGVAAFGLVVNVVTALVLLKANPGSDLNIRGAFVHMLSDTLSSVGVVVGAVVIHYTGWVVVDPILSVMITVFILVWVVSLFKSAIRVLLERTPRHLDVGLVTRTIMEEVPQVRDIHDLHIWEITTNMYNMTAHVVLDDIELHKAMPLISRVKEVVRSKFNIGHAIIQLECTCVAP